jgi:bifunctional non-homologous end joining protein LigD
MITHPEKLLFPQDGISKGEVASYYEAIAPVLLPHISGRPLTMERYPGGIGVKGFWQKDVSKGFPDWLERVEVPKKDGVVHHLLVNDTRSLLWMVNQNTITAHVSVSRTPALDRPDVCVLDLDPRDGDQPDVLRAAALSVRDFLAGLGLRSLVKTTGSKGFHIVVPLDGSATTGDVARFAHAAGRSLVQRDPVRLTQEFSKADRGGRILVDSGRNDYSATFAAAYTLRARAGAPVSAPCTWAEIESGTVGPRSFTLRNMAARLDAAGDIWSGIAGQAQSLREAMQRLSQGARQSPEP